MTESERDGATSSDAALNLGAFGGDVLFSDPLATPSELASAPLADLSSNSGSVSAEVSASVLTAAEDTNIFANDIMDGFAAVPAAIPSTPTAGQGQAVPPTPSAPTISQSANPYAQSANPYAQSANPFAQQQVPPAARPSTLGAATPVDVKIERRERQAHRATSGAKPTKIRVIVGLAIASFWLLGTLGNGIVGFFTPDGSSSVSEPTFSAPPVLSSDASDGGTSGDGPVDPSGDSTAATIDESALPAPPAGEVGAPSGTDAAGRPQHTNMTYEPDKMPANVGAIRIQLVRTSDPIRVETYVGTLLDSTKDTTPGSIYGWETEPNDPSVITMRMRATDPSTPLACGIFVDDVMVGFGRGVDGVLDCVYDPESLRN